jgi:hypothetical protein
MRSRKRTAIVAAAAVAAAVSAQAAVMPGAGFAVRTYPTPDTVQGGVARQGNALIVGQGSFGSGGERIVRLDGGSATTIATGFSSLGGFDLSGDDLYVVDNCFGSDFGCGSPTTGDTVYHVGSALSRTTAVTAAGSEVVPSGTFATPQDVIAIPGPTLLVSDAVGVGSGRIAKVVGTTVTNLVTGLDFTGGLATDGAQVFIANVDGSFVGSVQHFTLAGAPAGPPFGGLSGAYGVALDGGQVLVTGGFANDFTSTLLALSNVTVERARGFAFSADVSFDAARGAALVLDFGATAVTAICADADGDAVCDADCAGPAAVAKPKIKIGRQLTPPGDDTLSFKGSMTIPLAPALDPVMNGAKVLIDDADGRVIVDVVVPGGAYDALTRTGWQTTGNGSTFTYKNPTGLLGLTRVKVKKISATPGLVTFTVKGKHGFYDASGATLPIHGVLALGSAGQGGLATFPGPSPACVLVANGNTVNCK